MTSSSDTSTSRCPKYSPRTVVTTEAAVLKVLSDAHATAGGKQATQRSLLDLIAVFDTVDHTIMLDRLHTSHLGDRLHHT